HPGRTEQGHRRRELHAARSNQAERRKGHGRRQPGVGRALQKEWRVEDRVFALLRRSQEITNTRTKSRIGRPGDCMSESDDKKLGMDRQITRRDFLNGVAVGTGGAVAASALPSFALDVFSEPGAAQDRPGYYPPALTGLRGSHAGSFEAAHSERDGKFPAKGAKITETNETYDLVIVGGGISGIAAAYFWRAKNPNARILVLDNHDDFGGHAKRNEFRAGGRILLANGGTWAIES